MQYECTATYILLIVILSSREGAALDEYLFQIVARRVTHEHHVDYRHNALEQTQGEDAVRDRAATVIKIKKKKKMEKGENEERKEKRQKKKRRKTKHTNLDVVL